MSAPPWSRWVANEWRMVCGLTFRSPRLPRTYRCIIARTSRGVIRRFRRLQHRREAGAGGGPREQRGGIRPDQPPPVRPRVEGSNRGRLAREAAPRVPPGDEVGEPPPELGVAGRKKARAGSMQELG